MLTESKWMRQSECQLKNEMSRAIKEMRIKFYYLMWFQHVRVFTSSFHLFLKQIEFYTNMSSFCLFFRPVTQQLSFAFIPNHSSSAVHFYCCHKCCRHSSLVTRHSSLSWFGSTDTSIDFDERVYIVTEEECFSIFERSDHDGTGWCNFHNTRNNASEYPFDAVLCEYSL